MDLKEQKYWQGIHLALQLPFIGNKIDDQNSNSGWGSTTFYANALNKGMNPSFLSASSV